MNSLSWLLYLADVVESFGTAMYISFFFVCLFCVVLLMYGSTVGDTDFVRDKEEIADRKEKSKTAYHNALRTLAIGLPIVLLLSVVVPNKKTVMMIAASEFGEEIAISSEAKNLGGKAYQSLDKFLSDYLEEGNTTGD